MKKGSYLIEESDCSIIGVSSTPDDILAKLLFPDWRIKQGPELGGILALKDLVVGLHEVVNILK